MASPASLADLQIPRHLQDRRDFSSEELLLKWEKDLIEFFSSCHKLFTPYPNYFRLRTYEFRILRQLLPEYFRPGQKHESLLELGCGFGFQSLLLMPFCRKLTGVDIPEKYHAVGKFKTSVDMAKLLVNEKFRIDSARFETSWPEQMKLEPGSVSVLFSEYVLEHIPNLPAAIKEMHRVLRKDGLMIHVVPNTQDAALAFLDANINFSIRRLLSIAKSQVTKLLGMSHDRYRIKPNAIVVPPTHSEYTDSYLKQIEIYCLESYLFPMLDTGLRIEKIISTRERNNVIVARKV